ncbi:hypothetical protein E3N88_19707 [Mikania micrantha]|uniref:Mediator of RNA polymerase II transcription subunit 25 n=1 Tax=Mikania micrantha TaxID=192012 RepID=A0A5N6NP82_9ASTR|nr:hypothetical protein E3N88_19707 [Mikania micrantha]
MLISWEDSSVRLVRLAYILKLRLMVAIYIAVACLVQRSGWTRNVDYFFEWLSALHFSGGGFCDAAIAEGLGEVLMMFPYANVPQNQHNLGVQRHCIPVAASNSYPLPTPVYCPPIQKIEPSDNSEAQSESRLSDAETIAKVFSQVK